MATPSMLLVEKNRARMLDDAAGGGDEYDEDVKNNAIPLTERHRCLDRPPLSSPCIAVPVSFHLAPPPR